MEKDASALYSRSFVSSENHAVRILFTTWHVLSLYHPAKLLLNRETHANKHAHV